jgi:predicted XRE-type DNA-binding protein
MRSGHCRRRRGGDAGEQRLFPSVGHAKYGMIGRKMPAPPLGSGNVFEDLGHPRPAEALAKAELARRIAALIAERGLTQASAAELLKIDQPKVSALVRGRLAGFSLDRLVRFLVLLGSDVEIVVKPRTRATARARVLVA